MNIKKAGRSKILNHLEFIFLSGGLMLLLLKDPGSPAAFSICPSRIFHLSCPGCGIGRAIGMLMHGMLHDAVLTHFASILALPVILFRLISITKTLK